MSIKSDKKIKDMLKVIESKRKSLGSKPKASLITNGVLKTSFGEFNLNSITSLDKCVMLVSELVGLRSNDIDACEFLEVEVVTSHEGYEINNWMDDIKTRASIIKWDIEKKKLTGLEGKLKELRSEDAKTGDALDDIMEELGS